MPGLIEARLPTTDPNATTSYDPERIKVNADEDTVEGRVARIIAARSPLQTLAQTNATQVANSRGLRNSAMAVSAGERAVIESALPIAQQDAQTYFTARQLNQQAGNRALEFGAQGAQQIGQLREQGSITSRLQQEKADIDVRLQTSDGAIRERLLNRQAEIDQALQTSDGAIRERLMDRQGEIESQQLSQQIAGRLSEIDRSGVIQERLANIDGRWRTLIGASANAAGIHATAINSIGEILASDIPADQKQQLIGKITETLNAGLTLTGFIADIDLSPILGSINDPATPPPVPFNPGDPTTYPYAPGQIPHFV